MIEKDDDLITQAELMALLKVTRKTLWYWSVHGIRGRKLKREVISNRIYYKWSAIQEFQEPDAPMLIKPTPKQNNDGNRQYLKNQGFKIK